MSDIRIYPVASAADKKAFIELPYRLYANDPAFVPPLRSEANSLITPGKNPWFEHGEAQLYLAERDGRVVGRVRGHRQSESAQARVATQRSANESHDDLGQPMPHGG